MRIGRTWIIPILEVSKQRLGQIKERVKELIIRLTRESWFDFRFSASTLLFFPLLRSWRAKASSYYSLETPAGSIPKYTIGAIRYPTSSDVLGYGTNKAYPAADALEEMQHSPGWSDLVGPRLLGTHVCLHAPHLGFYSPSQPFHPSKQKKLKETLLLQKHMFSFLFLEEK